MWLAGVLVAHPLLALVPAAVFGLLARRTHRRSAWLAAVAWLIYAVYETAMAHRLLCSGDCDIRVDLLLIYPVLGVLSLLAVLIVVWPWRTRGPTRHDRSRP